MIAMSTHDLNKDGAQKTMNNTWRRGRDCKSRKRQTHCKQRSLGLGSFCTTMLRLLLEATYTEELDGDFGVAKRNT